MYRPPPPLPPVQRKPTLPLPLTDFDFQHDVPGMDSFEVATQKLLAMAETADKARLRSRMGASGLLMAAIDPATGDSVVHRAAAAGNLNVLHTIPTWFGRNLSQQPEREREFWLLVTHQNRAGDTALHAAARAGNRRGVKGVYRLFHRQDCFNVDSDDDDPESAQTDPPAEYWDWEAMRDDYPYDNRPALDFVCTKNRAGRDAAGEARAAGHEDLAVWLDGLVARLDRDGMREDEEYMREARLAALENHRYHEDDDSEEK